MDPIWVFLWNFNGAGEQHQGPACSQKRRASAASSSRAAAAGGTRGEAESRPKNWCAIWLTVLITKKKKEKKASAHRSCHFPEEDLKDEGWVYFSNNHPCSLDNFCQSPAHYHFIVTHLLLHERSIQSAMHSGRTIMLPKCYSSLYHFSACY